MVIFPVFLVGLMGLLVESIQAFSINHGNLPFPQRRNVNQRVDVQLFSSAGTIPIPQQDDLLQVFSWDEEESNDSEFDRLCRVHSVLETVRLQLPTLLSTPLTEASSKAVYDDQVELVVNDDIVLASSREELVALSTTLVLAVAATNQANAFFTLSSNTDNSRKSSSVSSSQQQKASSTVVSSQMAMDPTVQTLRVKWNVQLPTVGPRGSQQRRQLQGLSELELHPTTARVVRLRLLQVQWNDELLNARAIAESLASLRQLVLAVQKSPLAVAGGGLLPSFSSLLGTDFLQQVQAVATTTTTSTTDSEKSPLFVVESIDKVFQNKDNSNKASNNTTNNNNNTNTMIPIDDYGPTVLPGSSTWSRYVARRQVFYVFCREALTVLSGNKTIATKDMVELFAPQARLVAVDGSELLRGRDAVSNFFQTLASWRKRASGTWEIRNATLGKDKDKYKYNDKKQGNSTKDGNEITILVDYRATSSLPGTPTPVVIQGTDQFTLDVSYLSLTEETKASDDDSSGPEVLIKRIEQKKLEIVNGGVGAQADALWFMKSLVNALNTGRFNSMGGDSVVMELLQRVIAGDVNGNKNKKPRRKTPPKLPDATAVRVYRIMAGLHHDVPSIFDTETLRVYQLPPMHEFMSEHVELRGYLGESLARGRQAYNAAVGTSIASLKASLASGGVKLDQEPAVTVELTSQGHVRLTLSVELNVLPLPSGTSGLINSISGSAISLPSGGFPLQISIVSDYLVDTETREIYQHRLVETRVNGQLTPGDVISRWIKTQAVPSDGATNNNAALVQRGLIDAISWVRSVTNRG